jgi:hypothetical protein
LGDWIGGPKEVRQLVDLRRERSPHFAHNHRRTIPFQNGSRFLSQLLFTGSITHPQSGGKEIEKMREKRMAVGPKPNAILTASHVLLDTRSWARG